MKDLFNMNIVWHNCETNPPIEDWNECLFISDGRYVTQVSYNSQYGWFSRVTNSYIPPHELSSYWWIDLEKAIRTSQEFADAKREIN